MAARFGVSRSTVREAIQRLIARGMLTARPGSGVFVTNARLEQHAAVYCAVRKGESAGAAAAMARHLSYVGDQFKSAA